MFSQEIRHLIIKYLFRSATAQELDELNLWIQIPGNEFFFKDYIKTHFAITLSMNNADIDQIREQLRKEIKKDKSIVYRYRLRSVFKYAALAVFFMGIGYFFQQVLMDSVPMESIAPREDAITLQLDNGDIEVISEDGTSQVVNVNGKVIGVQQGKKLVYGDNVSEKKLVYNTLNIPKGRQFSIELSDGTQVHLNAGSSIKYPTTFLPKEQRQVFLTGEAFFEVAHDPNIPFIVNTQQLNVKVYGTTFNIANYPEDESTEVVLLEGSVSLMDEGSIGGSGEEIFLQPGFKGSFNKVERRITKEKVNTSIYTSWRNGNLIFRDISFENIIEKLERHYNVTIINNNKNLAKETFNATIETQHETIEQVFNYFNKVYRIEYKIVENKIIID